MKLLKYYIALTLLLIANKDVNLLLKEFNDNEIINLFEGKFTNFI